MARRRNVYRRVVWTFPPDFPDRLCQLKEASGLSWRALARQLGTDTPTVRRWRNGQRPNGVYVYALFAMAERLDRGSAILLEGYV